MTCPDLVTKSFVACGQVENVNLDDISYMKPGRPLEEAKPRAEELFGLASEEIDLVNVCKKEAGHETGDNFTGVEFMFEDLLLSLRRTLLSCLYPSLTWRMNQCSKQWPARGGMFSTSAGLNNNKKRCS